MEFTHNLGLMCDVLSELNDLSKQSESKKRGRDEVGKTGGRKEEVTEKKKEEEEAIRTQARAVLERVQPSAPEANGPCKLTGAAVPRKTWPFTALNYVSTALLKSV